MFRFVCTLFLLDSVTSVDRISTQGEYYSATRHRILRHEFFFNTGKARIRVQISAAHSTEEIERCVEAFIDVGKKKGVI